MEARLERLERQCRWYRNLFALLLIGLVVAALLTIGCSVSGGSGNDAVDTTDPSVTTETPTTPTEPEPAPPSPALRNVILMIGDGMGPEHVKAGGYFVDGGPGMLVFEGFPYIGEVTTASADAAITDSAAAATAMATGQKVNNGVISLALPGDGTELQTALEIASAAGKSTGLVTTTVITHATPAAFAAHTESRGNSDEIAMDYFNQTHPEVLFGGGSADLYPANTEANGYTVVTDASELLALDPAAVTRVSGQFGIGHLPYVFDDQTGILPSLPQMTAVALAILERDPDGFFLLVEGGRIDHAGHANHIERNVRETAAFADAVTVARTWAEGRDDTLILVTADHETGGLVVVSGNGAGAAPTVTWSTQGHTAVNVAIYAWGNNASLISGTMDNTDLFGALNSWQEQPNGARLKKANFAPYYPYLDNGKYDLTSLEGAGLRGAYLEGAAGNRNGKGLTLQPGP